jgi:hypothetical protein
MKTKREQDYGDLLVIKLFVSNYARDLLYIITSSEELRRESELSKVRDSIKFKIIKLNN